jgi:hypothetical protein
MGLFTGIFFCIFQVGHSIWSLPRRLWWWWSSSSHPRGVLGVLGVGVGFFPPQLTQVVGNLVAGCIFMYGGSNQDQAR